MCRVVYFALSSLFIVAFAVAQTDLRYDFSKATAAENGITIMGAGFGASPQAEVTFGAIPTDNAFNGATDGTGMTVQADPGEGVMFLTAPI